MKVREYMQTHAGTYVPAEEMAAVTLGQIAPALADEDVEPMVVGIEPDGSEKIQLYSSRSGAHLLTYLREPALSVRS
jgi:hypothetical protein